MFCCPLLFWWSPCLYCHCSHGLWLVTFTDTLKHLQCVVKERELGHGREKSERETTANTHSWLVPCTATLLLCLSSSNLSECHYVIVPTKGHCQICTFTSSIFVSINVDVHLVSTRDSVERFRIKVLILLCWYILWIRLPLLLTVSYVVLHVRWQCLVPSPCASLKLVLCCVSLHLSSASSLHHPRLS